MKIFNFDRGTGKTTLLIILSHFTNARIITSSESSAKYVAHLANKMNLSIPLPKSYNNYINNPNQIKDEKILIDELDIILTMIFKREILAATRTEGD